MTEMMRIQGEVSEECIEWWIVGQICIVTQRRLALQYVKLSALAGQWSKSCYLTRNLPDFSVAQSLRGNRVHFNAVKPEHCAPVYYVNVRISLVQLWLHFHAIAIQWKKGKRSYHIARKDTD